MKAITIEDNEPYLRQISTNVNINNLDELKSDINILEDFCKSNEVMAMAAIQLGIPKRLIYLKNTNLDIISKQQVNETTEEEKNYNEQRILINPVIIKKEGLTKYWEACASCLDNTGLVKRPYRIVVEYFGIDGLKHTDTFEGFESTVLSHEMDHLDGILHMDIADKVLVMSKEDRKKLRQSEGYNILNKNDDYDKLKNINFKIK